MEKTFSGKKFLITGVAGFVAEYFLEYAYSNYSNITVFGLDVIDNVSYKYPDFHYKKIDLMNKDLIKEFLDNYKPDYILHLASASSVAKSWIKPVETFLNNTNIFLNLVEALRELEQNPRILSIGSSEEYGDYPEDKLPLKEDYKLNPNSPYSVARASQEWLSKIYADSYGIDIIMTRSFNHIGPRQRDCFVIPSFVKQMVDMKKYNKEKILHVGNIDIIRDFLDVRDVVRAYSLLLKIGKKGEIYNVCSGHGTKLREIINIIAKKLDINPKIVIDKDKIRPSDSIEIFGDNKKLKNELGWDMKYCLEDTIDDMIEFYDKH